MKMHGYLISPMSPALNRTTALQHFERGNAVEIHSRIIFNSYLKVVVSVVQFLGFFLVLRKYLVCALG